MRLLLRGVSAAAALAAAVGAAAFTPATPAVAASAPDLVLTWTAHAAVGNSTFVTLSSPNVATVGGVKAVVVGDKSGHVYAYNLATGATISGWPKYVGAPVTSTPSAAPTPGTVDNTILVGTGDAASPCGGGYQWLYPNGSQTSVQETNPPTDPYCTGHHNGVAASMAVGTLQGQTATVAGSLGQETYAMNASNRALLSGFPWFQADSNFSTPAIADVERTGSNQIIEGGASTAGTAYGFHYSNGGHIRILRATGNAGTGTPGGGLVCQDTTNQTVTTSPAVGEIFGSTSAGIVDTTGTTWAGASQTDEVIAMNTACQQVWARPVTGTTATQSPAIADVLGNGQLQVVETTGNGWVYALNGPNGSVAWSTKLARPILGSPVTADLGAGHQDVLVASTNGLYILTGTSGAVLETQKVTTGFQNAPLVTDDPNGSVGITVAGYQNTHGDVIYHFEIPGSNGSAVDVPGAWPQFHHDPQLTGDTGTPPPVHCTPPPTGHPSGYVMAAADGGIFNFGNLQFCGSMGGHHLNQPIVGMAETKDAGGYWEVASDGGIFTFGNAGFYGSMGGHHLNEPIVGMAADTATGGYWEVASDGGIFTFDAPFLGSMGGHPLNAPVVGMAATPTGGGYWEVASDGGIFTFGNAPFYGSMGGHHLNEPIVAIAADPATGGYWEVASDGGIFTFDAPFLGSTGSMHLNKPIVAMAATSTGGGYWLIASDGGIFTFGNAGFDGSMGGTRLNQPVVAAAGD